jgi:hypothetical protein
LKKKITIKDAVQYFTANRETIPVFSMRKGDFALQLKPEDHLYLVVEAKDKGIFLARLGPDLMRLKSLSEDEQKSARDFAYKRFAEAGLL